tara:strand:- start:47 stop:529 length:483 start_codon:yes stop_codon:yes gene_type:complete
MLLIVCVTFGCENHSLSYKAIEGYQMKLYPTDNSAKFKNKEVGELHIGWGGKIKRFCIRESYLHPEKPVTNKTWKELFEVVPLVKITENDLNSAWGEPTQQTEYSTIPSNHSKFSTYKLKGVCRQKESIFLIDVKFWNSKLCAYRIRGQMISVSKWLGTE